MAAGDEKSDQAKVEHELLQIQKRKGGLKVRAMVMLNEDLMVLVSQPFDML